jgi:hypothetical protein
VWSDVDPKVTLAAAFWDLELKERAGCTDCIQQPQVGCTNLMWPPALVWAWCFVHIPSW